MRAKSGFFAASASYSRNAAVRATPVRFYLFDVLYLDGVDLTPLPYVDRRDALQRLGILVPAAVALRRDPGAAGPDDPPRRVDDHPGR